MTMQEENEVMEVLEKVYEKSGMPVSVYTADYDWKNHYDVWDEDFVPIKIRDCLDALDKGLYIARSENHNIH